MHIPLAFFLNKTKNKSRLTHSFFLFSKNKKGILNHASLFPFSEESTKGIQNDKFLFFLFLKKAQKEFRMIDSFFSFFWRKHKSNSEWWIPFSFFRKRIANHAILIPFSLSRRKHKKDFGVISDFDLKVFPWMVSDYLPTWWRRRGSGKISSHAVNDVTSRK